MLNAHCRCEQSEYTLIPRQFQLEVAIIRCTIPGVSLCIANCALSIDPVPTPIQHIILAEQLLSDATLPAPLRDELRAQRGAFLFGNTAPDVQVVSNQLR